jgi:hypothetical protein
MAITHLKVCGAVHAPIQVTDTADIDKLQRLVCLL